MADFQAGVVGEGGRLLGEELLARDVGPVFRAGVDDRPGIRALVALEPGVEARDRGRIDFDVVVAGAAQRDSALKGVVLGLLEVGDSGLSAAQRRVGDAAGGAKAKRAAVASLLDRYALAWELS